MSGLIWVQTVCKGYQITLADFKKWTCDLEKIRSTVFTVVLRVEDLTRREGLEVLVSAVAHLGKSFVDSRRAKLQWSHVSVRPSVHISINVLLSG